MKRTLKSGSGVAWARLQGKGMRGIFVSGTFGLRGRVSGRSLSRSGRGVLVKLLEATHCLSRNLLLSSFLLLDDSSPFLFATIVVRPFHCHLAHFLQLVFVFFSTPIKNGHFDWLATVANSIPLKDGQWTLVLLTSVFLVSFLRRHCHRVSSRWSMFSSFQWVFSTFMNLVSVFISENIKKEKI